MDTNADQKEIYTLGIWSVKSGDEPEFIIVVNAVDAASPASFHPVKAYTMVGLRKVGSASQRT
jgi:hypothetical protein